MFWSALGMLNKCENTVYYRFICQVILTGTLKYLIFLST